MYNQHKKFRRLRSDNDYSKLSREDTIKQLRIINEFDVTKIYKNAAILKNKLKIFERTRNLMFWHDGSTISNHSYILVMVSCLNDPAVFLTDEDYSKSNDVLANYKPLWKSLSCTYLLVLLPLTNKWKISRYSENRKSSSSTWWHSNLRYCQGFQRWSFSFSIWSWSTKRRELCFPSLLHKFSLH